MKGLSERDYAQRIGLSRGAVQKARAAGRLVLYDDGSINPDASDERRAAATDPSKSRRADPGAAPAKDAGGAAKAVPNAAISAVGATLQEGGQDGGGTTYVQAKTANEVLKAQRARLELQKAKGELVERQKAQALVFRLARQERDAWQTWPARVAALMAADLGADAATVQQVLDQYVRSHLSDLADLRVDLDG